MTASLITSNNILYQKGLLPNSYTMFTISSVWGITWMSDKSMHMAKWMTALEQVTVMHLVKYPLQFLWKALGEVEYSGTQPSDSPHSSYTMYTDMQGH